MELRLAAQRVSVARARHWVTDRARDESLGEHQVQVVELLTSELVANAVRHGPAGGGVTVRTACADHEFMVLVLDESPEPPVVRHTAPDVPGGQGMRLVDRLASAWGVVVRPPGKTVWFQVHV